MSSKEMSGILQNPTSRSAIWVCLTVILVSTVINSNVMAEDSYLYEKKSILSKSSPKASLNRFDTTFSCVNAVLKVITYCEKKETIDGLRPACPQQIFISSYNNKLVSRRQFFYRNYKTNFNRANALQCLIGNESKHYIVVNYTNLGNGMACDECEWNEYYSARDGAYIGSQKSKYQGDVNMREYISDTFSKNFDLFTLNNSTLIKDTEE